MKRRNATRSALFTSIISLLLCVSMLVGTTFAWFTDEVVTGMNTIAAGNLDVELYANGVLAQTLTYSVNTYAYRMGDAGNANAALALALYNYGVAAGNYVA